MRGATRDLPMLNCHSLQFLSGSDSIDFQPNLVVSEGPRQIGRGYSIPGSALEGS